MTTKWLTLPILWLALAALPANAQSDTPTGQSEAKVPTAAKPDTDDNTPIKRLAELTLDEYLVAARGINIPLPGRTKTVQDVLDKLDNWTKDDEVGAVVMNLGMVQLGMADVEELRGALQRMKRADKRVMAYLNGATPPAYLLACAADEICVGPTGNVIIPGLGRVFPYMRGYFQMQGVEWDIITAGKFKYPGFYNRRGPDEAFQEEFGAILDSWYGDYKRMIAEGRNLPEAEVGKLVDEALFNADDALHAGLVDKIAYYDEYYDRLLSRYKLKKLRDGERGLEDVNSIQDFVEMITREIKKAEEARTAVGPKIAILNARGPIIDADPGAAAASLVIAREPFCKTIDELRKDKSIKAVVMHIDSPGGSGYASDVIWQHLKELDETKPLVVCQGNVAGSGGYYLSSPGRKIFAHPTTITGSIGVIGMFQNNWSQYNRMDVNLAEMQRGKRALLGSDHRGMSDEDHALLQTWMMNFYRVFLDRVATGRKMPVDQVDKIAQGRIWTGRDAKKIGLVDELGGMSEAIQAAREMAGIPASAELRIVHYPRFSSLGELFGSLGAVSSPQMSLDLDAGNAATGADLLARIIAASQRSEPTPFEQLQMLTQRIQPLCWMAAPEFWRPDGMQRLTAPTQPALPR